MEVSLGIGEKMFWDLVKVKPSKWQLPPWGDEGDGFWVVALAGNIAIYYNDIEHGYNVSSYTEHGSLSEYVCDQVSLIDIIANFVRSIKDS